MRLSFENVVKTFAGKTVLAGVSADFGEARAVVLIGPSGGGKSTLLRILAGLEMLDSGAVRMGGVDVDFSSEERLREWFRECCWGLWRLVFGDSDNWRTERLLRRRGVMSAAPQC